MQNQFTAFIFFISLFTVSFFPEFAKANGRNEIKEWTFLTYLNGNNNLDSYGTTNLIQMEKVGSTADINVVVQWASLAHGKTVRLYIEKSTDPSKVTSPVVEDMGAVDMGDWHSLVDFVKWGVTRYPAKHYFINVWDHGSGWRAMHLRQLGLNRLRNFHPTDISWDDNTGHSMTTVQLGEAISQSAKIIGHKVDIYGSDACLMAMAEVANEMADSVSVYVGSEEVEPAEGWPYDAFLGQWTKDPKASSADVGKLLTSEYVKSYQGGGRNVTFSAFDLGEMDKLNLAISHFGSHLMKLDPQARKKVKEAMGKTQTFTYSDYGDLVDFLTGIEKAEIKGVTREALAEIRDAVKAFVLANSTSPFYAKAGGVAIWLPPEMSIYQSYSTKYNGLRFQSMTQWGNALHALLEDASP